MEDNTEYFDYEDKLMRELGFDPKAFTRAQIRLTLQPIEAPEDYACDGEVTADEAKEYWVNGLEKYGLTTGQILLIVKRVLG